MKKVGIVLLLLAVAAGVLYLSLQPQEAPSDYIRIHIRADSDNDADQAVKYKVRDAVVEYLVPVLADCADYSSAKKALKQNLSGIEAAADQVLRAESKAYTAKAMLKREEFPVRQYGGLTLDAGVYDALILELGSASGQNWWCVAFPPLCFVPAAGSKEVVYKSKIVEIIDKFKEKKNNEESD